MGTDLLTWRSPAQVGKELDITPNRVRQLIVEGKLSCVMTANGRLIDPASIEALKKERQAKKEVQVELAR